MRLGPWRCLGAALLAGIAGCTAAVRPAPRPAPATGPGAELVGVQLRIGDEAQVAGALARRLRAGSTLEVAQLRRDPSGGHLIVALVGVTRGAPERRPAPKRGPDGEEEPDLSCGCRYSPLIEKGTVHVLALARRSSGWQVVGYHREDAGAGRCKISVGVIFGDRNGNGSPDVVLAIGGFNDGCPAVGEEWSRHSTLWELGRRGFVEQLDLGRLEGVAARPTSGHDYTFTQEPGGKRQQVVITSVDDRVRASTCLEAEDDLSSLEGKEAEACKTILAGARRYRWSAAKGGWRPYR